jgi:hypothetical protein
MKEEKKEHEHMGGKHEREHQSKHGGGHHGGFGRKEHGFGGKLGKMHPGKAGIEGPHHDGMHHK